MSESFYLLLLFAILHFMMFLWEILQIISEPASYLKDKWNYIDIQIPLLVIYWVLAAFLEIKSEYESYFLAVLLSAAITSAKRRICLGKPSSGASSLCPFTCALPSSNRANSFWSLPAWDFMLLCTFASRLGVKLVR